MEPTAKRRLGLACLGLGLVTASIAASGGVASAHPGPEPPPVVVPDGSCADFAASHGGGQAWLEVTFEVDELYDGSSKGGVTLTWNGDNTFDWSAPLGIDAVFVGAAAQGQLYVYAPTATSFEHVFDDGLTAAEPITHISFCYDGSASTTSTTTEPTTTSTTEATTTTTTEATTTTTTTLPGGVAGVSVTAGQPPPTAAAEVAGIQASRSLPRTGADDDLLLAAGLGLIVAGVALVLVGDGARVLGMRRR